MRSVRILSVLALITAPAAFAQSGSAATQAAATISVTDVKRRVEFLASDSLQGRDTPSPGLEIAAQYIADEFKKFGLKPAGDSGSYIQRWPYAVRSLNVSKSIAELHGANQHKTLAYGSEYFVIPAPMVDSLVGEIVLAGVAGPNTQPDPAFAGKVVTFLVPGGDLSQEWQQAAQGAIGAALGAGAKGAVLILDPQFDADDIANLVSNLGGALVPIPVLGVRNDAANAWLAGTDANIDFGQASAAPRVIAGASVRVRTSMAGSMAKPPNVVGILEGSDPVLKDSYVVFSAHMDHVGVGKPNAKGDSIYNGADDDASGTTAVIEAAEAFASLKQRPKRSIIFLLVSGEEKGLFGSRYFVDNPPVPTAQMVANINLDMIGRNASDSTVAIGQELSSLGETTQSVAKAHPELKLTVAPDLWPEENLFFRSDHFNFAMKKIPAIFFTSGLHEDYHQPSDEPETIDNDKLARTARLVFYIGDAIANNATAPSWTEAGLKAINQAAGTN
ncbi:MAG: M20/M25/M40 family metallo-hydrolase [Gemmatimonadota bacterium]